MARILVVDDNPRVRTALRLCIHTIAAWQVCGEAGDGREAVDMVQRLNPDVVLLDYAMPNMKGIEAARLISSSTREPLIILFTMFASKELSSLAQVAGVRAVVSKDVGGINALLQTIKELTTEAA